MSRLARTLAWALAGILAVAPLSATVYKVTLKNGSVFETRYQPEDASWDAGKIVLLDEMGLLISIPKDDVQDIVSDVEAKGYGSVIDDTTMYLGWAPNEGEDAAAGGAPAAGPQVFGQQEPPITYNQFVEPDQTQGMPGTWVGYPVNAPTQPQVIIQQVAPAPAPAPAPAAPPSDSGQ